MRTYFCGKCEKEYQLEPSEVNARNEKAWCYCTPATPTRLDTLAWKKEQKKYENVFKQSAL